MKSGTNSLGINGILLCVLGIFPSMFFGVSPLYICFILSGTATILISVFNSSDNMVKLFEGLGLANKNNEMPSLVNKETFEYGTKYTVSIPEGLNTNDFIKEKLSFEQYFNARVEFEYKDKTVEIKVYNNGLKELYPFKLIQTDHPCTIVLGYMLNGLLQFQLKQNMLIAGTAGYGKSTLLRGILTQLIKNSNKTTLALNLVDFKRVELGIFKKAEQVVTFCTNAKQFIESLKRLEKEALRRYELFEKENILDIYTYNKTHSKKLQYIVTVIDEVGQFEGNVLIMNMLTKRLSFDRAAGIYYILTTQRPSVTILPGDIKANIDIRICFKTVDSTNSWIVLDQKETAEYLTIRGRGLCKMEGELKEFQAMYLDEKDVSKLIKDKEVQSDKRTG